MGKSKNPVIYFCNVAIDDERNEIIKWFSCIVLAKLNPMVIKVNKVYRWDVKDSEGEIGRLIGSVQFGRQRIDQSVQLTKLLFV